MSNIEEVVSPTLFGGAFQSWENSQCSPFRHAPWAKNLQRTLKDSKDNKLHK